MSEGEKAGEKGSDPNGTKFRRAPFKNNRLRGLLRLRNGAELLSEAWNA